MIGTVAALPPTVGVNPALAAQVPTHIRADGVVTVAVDPTYEPSQFTRPGSTTVVGVDADLVEAVAERLGLTVRWQRIPLDSIITHVQAGDVELGVSAIPITDTATTQVTMVSYLTSGTRWLARAGTEQIGPETACGRTVAVVAGTIQTDDLTDRSARCTSSGQPPVTVVRYNAVQDAQRALGKGEVDAFVSDSHVCDYLVSISDDRFRTAGNAYDPVTFGFAVRTKDRDFATTLHKALAELIDNGAYARILRTWGQEHAAIRTSELRP
ncbi:transporter substrate-binding domain-containing protein [Virgisporangium ochraceum]|nr:transporter substrate-binding domain-containing protein [Virgisporangium ochraceum]